ncbi:unnamed protein product [Psylliodes chrysocephalus]|uniref:Uncharacterized protein n=1 Tax=Psylliodes chrysocephalus TaxID=3402493 RepID=A0A9P0G7J2_9CUCU|nr:unnamed protein product [Psylliodes chrysocephala]
MFEFNSKILNYSVFSSFEFSNLQSDIIEHFLESVEDDVKQVIHTIKICHCEITDAPEVIINDYPNLETLDLQDNNLDNINFISKLPNSIKELYLGQNKISTVSDVFFNLKDLEVVDLSGCDIESLNFMVFKDNGKLLVLNVSHNKIESSESEEYLKNIKCVDFSYNKLTKYSNIPSLCLDFSYTNLSGYHWFNISAENQTVLIEKFYFSGNSRLKLRATNIKNDSLPLVIKFFNISNFQGDVSDLELENVKVRKYLSLKDSKKVILDKSTFDFKLLFFSEGTNATFDLSNCSIDDIPNNYFEEYNLGRLNLCYNNFPNLKENLFKNAYIVELDLCKSNIKDVDNNTFSGLHVHLLNLSKNKLQNLTFLKSIETVRFVDLSENNIKILTPNQFFNIKNLEVLELSNNEIISLEKNVFNNNLQVLKLNGNKISEIKNGTFYKLTNLRELYLDDNPIIFVDNNAFENLPILEVLSMATTEVYVLKPYAIKNVNSLKKVYFKATVSIWKILME